MLRRLGAGNTNVDYHWIENFGRQGATGITGAEWKERIPQMYFWFDWISIPQAKSYQALDQSGLDDTLRDLANAVQSIPLYVAAASLMVVLVPRSLHVDRKEICNYESWSRRDWCVAEFQARFLAEKEGPVMILLAGGTN